MLTFNTEVIFTAAATDKQYFLDRFTSLEITSSWKHLGEMATIKLGKLRGQLNKQLVEGDGVEIRLGYDGVLYTEFVGYVTRLLPNQPFEIRCLDEVYHLQRTNINQSWKETTLQEVIETATQGQGLDIQFADKIPEVELKPFRVANASAAKVLQKLKSEYGLAIYFRGKSLYVGLPYSEDTGTTFPHLDSPIIYDLQKNVLATELEYRQAKDIKVKLKAISILKNNKKLEVTVGSEGGGAELRTWISPEPISNKATLKKIAEEKIGLYKYSGYKGSIKTLGIPFVVHSARCKIKDATYPEREGLYFVNEVKTSITKSGGFKRMVKIGRKAN
ncbi:MAG TPA: hypothetical protein DCS93_35680 [Microscillaceae bacterium]|nr:hypothetical protein [Microscillaceae bacterium]